MRAAKKEQARTHSSALGLISFAILFAIPPALASDTQARTSRLRKAAGRMPAATLGRHFERHANPPAGHYFCNPIFKMLPEEENFRENPGCSETNVYHALLE